MSNIINYDEWLKESLSSDNDLLIISNIIIQLSVRRFLEYYDMNKLEYKIYKKSDTPIYNSPEFVWFLSPVLIKYDDLKYSKKLSKEFLQCLKKSKYIRIEYLEKRNNVLGDFNNDYQINLYVDIKDDENSFLRQSIIEDKKSYDLHKFFNQFKSTLIHELQHYIDKWRSDLKYIDSKKKVLWANIDSFTNDEYLKFSHEISARYTQTLLTLTAKKGYSNFKDLLKDFKEKFTGWDIIDIKIKNRLIHRLGQYFSSIKKDNLKISNDKMKEIISKIKNKYDVGVNIFNDKFIDIYDGDVEKLDYEKIIPELIKLSDIYKYDITVYAESKRFKEYLKSIGFKKNSGKDIRYDVSYSNWYYKSKRS